MRSDVCNAFIKVLNERNGVLKATHLILKQGHGGSLSCTERDELSVCLRIAKKRVGAL